MECHEPLTLLELKPWVYGTFAAYLVYGAISITFVAYTRVSWSLMKKGPTTLQKLLTVYVVIAYILATLEIVADTRACASLLSLMCLDDVPNDDIIHAGAGWIGNICFMLTSWSADMLLIWRFLVLYHDNRVRKWVVLVISLTVMTGCIIIGGLAIPSLSNPLGSNFGYLYIYEGLTLTQNIFLTSAIVIRLHSYRRTIQRALGPSHGQEYISIAEMLIESQAILILAQIALLVAGGTTSVAIGNIFIATYEVIGQCQVLSPLIVIYRVMQGKANDVHSMSRFLAKSEDNVLNPRYNISNV